MPGRMDDCGNVVLPKGNTFGFVVRNYGRKALTAQDTAVLCVQDKEGDVMLRKTARGEKGLFRFFIEIEDTQDMAEGVYVWDVTIECGGEGEERIRYSYFAPDLPRFVIGRVADGNA